jgi:methyltransferase-like protein
MVRDLLRYQVRGLSGPRARLEAARTAIDQYAAAFAGRPDPVSRMLHDELRRLRTRHPSYVYHEYLVDENTPQLFSEFMAEAARHGLQYLCETELHTMFADDLDTAAQALVDAGDDIVHQEQTLDFLRNRLFRQTLLCRTRVPLNRELDLERFAALAYHASLAPAEAPDLARPGDQAFVTPEGEHCRVSHPLTKAALLELAEAYPAALTFADLAERAAQRVRRAGGPAVEREALLLELLRLFLRQVVGGALQAEPVPRPDRTRPCASPLARAQVAAGLGHVATARHKPMGLDAFVARLIGYLDGRRERGELIELLRRDLESGRLTLDGERPTGAALTATVAANVDRMLAMLAQQGVLVPAEASP